MKKRKDFFGMFWMTGPWFVEQFLVTPSSHYFYTLVPRSPSPGEKTLKSSINMESNSVNTFLE